MELKALYRNLLKLSVKAFGVAFTKKADALIRFHRIINLNKPVTLADKLCYLELFKENPLKIRCTDKYEVRSYVKEKGLEVILVPLIAGPFTSASELKFKKLPNQFVLKATNGCGMNILCEDKTKADWQYIQKMAKRWLKEGYTRACIEPHYLKIPNRIICEKLLPDAEHIIDYKIHCFYGVPDFILVCGNRLQKVQKKLYTPDWKPIDAVVGRERSEFDFAKPQNLDQMLKISKVLSEDFDFVRVDLYNIKGTIFFGELTFSPASGVLPNFSTEFVAEKGNLLHL